MKLIRVLFQISGLLFILVAFSQPLLADSGSTLHAATPFAQFAPATKGYQSHHLISTILDDLESIVMGDIVPLVAFLLFARAIWLMLPSAQVDAEVVEERTSRIIRPRIEATVVNEQPPVEVAPPLRPIPERITLF